MKAFYPEAWGVLLREMRIGSGWRQSELAREADIDYTLISHWENGRAGKRFGPTREQAFRLAKVFAGCAGGLQRPADVVDWLGLIGLSVADDELVRMGTGERWRAGLASARFSRYQVPPLPIPHLERTNLMRQAKASLLGEANGRAPLVLAGMGGVGKSTLAAALARDREVRARLPHGVLWAQMRSPPEEAERVVRVGGVLRRWAQVLGVEVRPEETIEGTLARWLERKRVLLVIDNAEEYDEIRPLLVGGPMCRTVIATRNRGVIRNLPAGSPLVEVETLSEEEGEQLLTSVLGEKAADLERKQLREIVIEVGGNTLALLVAGRDAKAGSVEQTLVNLRDPAMQWLQVLSPTGVDDPNRSVAVSFSLSYGRLGSEGQRCYRALGQLPGPVRFTPGVFQAMAKVSDRGQAKALLRAFVDRSLLGIDGEGYRLHPLLFKYARRLLKDAKEWDPEHEWVERYEGEWVRKWWHLLPSVPRAPGATVRARGGWRQWTVAGIREFVMFVRQRYEEGIAEAWNPRDMPLERWIALMRLKRREQAYRREGLRRLGMVFLAAMVALILLGVLPTSPLSRSWLLRVCYPLMYVMAAIQQACLVVAVWLMTVQMIDLHRLWNWRR